MNIDNLEEKLEGKVPITRNELIELVNSWGRTDSYDYSNICECKANECYDLSNLDVSKITNMADIFMYSYYNGDISKWDISSCVNMERMFFWSYFNNDSINYWNVSNVKNMSEVFSESYFDKNISNWNVSNVETMNEMFSYSKFNGDISSWNISNVKDMTLMFAWSDFDGDISKWKFNYEIECEEIFFDNYNFETKYNAGNNLPDETKKFLEWFKKNRINIANANITNDEKLELDDYLSNFESKDLTNGN